MKRPVMIGAHVPAKAKKTHRGSVAEAGRDVQRGV